MTLPERKKLLGERVRDLRLARGWSFKTAADACQLNERVYWGVDAAKNFPSVPTLLKICEGLNATPDYLLGFDE